MISGPVLSKYFPVTQSFGLINSGLESFTAELMAWLTEIGQNPRHSRITSGLADAFEALPPLTMYPQRDLLVHVNTDWSAYFASGIRGSDPAPVMGYLAKRMQVRTMCVSVPIRNRKPQGAQWTVYSHPTLEVVAHLGIRRGVTCMKDGSRWSFAQLGEPFDFEDCARYEANRIPARFDGPLLREYLLHLGFDAFADETFVVDEAHAAQLIERDVPVGPGCSYAEIIARENPG